MTGENKHVLSMNDKEMKKSYDMVMRGVEHNGKGSYRKVFKSGYRKVSLLKETSVSYSIHTGCV